MDAIQETTAGRRLVRSAVLGALAGMFAFVYLPLWVVPVFVAIGVALGLAAPLMRQAYLRRREDPPKTSGNWASPR